MRIRSDLVLVGVLSAVGLAQRVAQYRQGLWGDELITVDDLDHSFRGMLDAVGHGLENSPPLYFVLAWPSRKLGNDPNLIRLPSVVLGTATIPLVAWVGSRTVGRWAGVVGAGFVALSPFATYYSTEGRPYATLMFTSVLSVALLLAAVERRTTGWWAAYGLSLAAGLYSHYTGVFVLAGQLGWAIWATRRSPKGLVVACACAALAFAPWLPTVRGTDLDVYGKVATILGLTRSDALVSWIIGLFLSPGEMPGRLALGLLGAATLIGLTGLVWRPGRALPSTVVLILLLASITPAGVFAYSLFSNDLFVFPRNLVASLPFLGLALGWLLVRLPPPAAVAALALAGLALALGALSALSDGHSRPAFPALARYVDSSATPRDVLVYEADEASAIALDQSLGLYFRRNHPTAIEPDPSRWASHLRGQRLVVITTWGPGQAPASLAPAHALSKLRERLFPALQATAAAVYRPDRLHGPHSYSLRGHRLVPARGAPIQIRPTGVDGLIQPVQLTGSEKFVFSGWANHDLRPVDKVVAFAGRKLVYADVPDAARPDVAGDPRKGQALGFDFEVPLPLLRSAGRVTAYALWDGAAYRLGYWCDPKAEQPIPCPKGAAHP